MKEIKKNIFIAGHNGMVGSSIDRAIQGLNQNKVLTKTRNELDLTIQKDVNKFFEKSNIDEVYLAAAKVGGIMANSSYPGEFIYKNIMIQSNVIDASYKNNIKKLLFLGSSCIYPKFADQPIKEEYLLTGSLEQTNEPYAIAKIAGISLCQSYNRQFGTDYRCVMPTNLYGEGDNYHPNNSHVIPGLIRRFHESKIKDAPSISIWGTGTPMREFLYVDDMADACLFVMNLQKNDYKSTHLNIGSGNEVSISDLANIIGKEVGYAGKILFDKSKPDGTPRKLLDSSKINNLGWKSKIGLEEGIQLTYQKFLRKIKNEGVN
jgi:GDP-L-fucose synthase